MVKVPIQNDDIYVNDGESFSELGGDYYPTAPEVNKEAERTEVAITAASYPVMADIAEWFKNEIVECSNIDNIVMEDYIVNGVTYSRKVSIEGQVLAMQLLKEKLQSRFDKYKEFVQEVDA